MRNWLFLAAALCFCLACPSAFGAVYTLAPPDPDLGDLTHQKYYTWGINRPWAPAHDGVYEEAVAVSLAFDRIRNWDNHNNDLYVHLLDFGKLGITIAADNQGGGDNFAGQGVLLTHYVNLPPAPQDLVYHFTDEQVGVLNSYAADGRFALGFDPDCHFYNCGVELEIVTNSVRVPEPGVVCLLASGSAIVCARRRRRSARQGTPLPDA